MKETKKYTSQNRLAWDEIAEVRSKGEPVKEGAAA